MPGKGTPVHTIRLPSELVEDVDAQIDSLLLWSKSRYGWGKPIKEWTRTSFIIAAIREKLAKMKRSRKPRGGSRGCNTPSRPTKKETEGETAYGSTEISPVI